MKKIPKRMGIEDAAKAGGLGRAYTTIYGYISMIAHGRAINLRTNEEIKEELYASVSGALGHFNVLKLLQMTGLAIENKQRKRH